MAVGKETVEIKQGTKFGKVLIVKEVRRGNKVRFFAVDMNSRVVAEAPTRAELEEKL